MKNKLPLLLALVFVALIAVGLYAALHNRNQEAPPAGPGSHENVSESGETPVIPIAGSASRNTRLPQEQWLSVALPSGTPSHIKDYEGFRVSFNEENRTPNWVAWELLESETEGGEGRHGKFWQDTDVPGCPDTRDYSNSGLDRGHLCPAADQKWSARGMEDCFSLANIAPQDHDLNTGAWKTLENKERSWAKRDSALVIVAGPLYSDSDKKRIGRAGVRVPGAFFKVLVAPYAEKPRGIAFVYPNMTAPGNMQQYAMSIRELEKLSGYDFFSSLPRSLQDSFETTASFSDWNHR